METASRCYGGDSHGKYVFVLLQKQLEDGQRGIAGKSIVEGLNYHVC